MPLRAPPVVVGAGIAGVACARELVSSGLNPRVFDRSLRIGGRLAERVVDGRAVDVGASYFTATDPAFVAVLESWVARGLARPWTDTFHLATPDGIGGTTTGPMRYAAPRGLSSLVEDLAVGLTVAHPYAVTEITPGREGPIVGDFPSSAAVLAMPGPEACVLLDRAYVETRATADVSWQSSLALVTAWPQRRWPHFDAVFVNDSPVVTFIADDGSRHGDAAPVLVAYADPVFAVRHVEDPAAAIPTMLAELRAVLGIAGDPDRAEVTLWPFAKPILPRVESFFLDDEMIGLCGDGWHAPSRVEAAYLSGRALGQELARRLP